MRLDRRGDLRSQEDVLVFRRMADIGEDPSADIWYVELIINMTATVVRVLILLILLFLNLTVSITTDHNKVILRARDRYHFWKIYINALYQ